MPSVCFGGGVYVCACYVCLCMCAFVRLFVPIYAHTTRPITHFSLYPRFAPTHTRLSPFPSASGLIGHPFLCVPLRANSHNSYAHVSRHCFPFAGKLLRDVVSRLLNLALRPLDTALSGQEMHSTSLPQVGAV